MAILTTRVMTTRGKSEFEQIIIKGKMGASILS